jgi:hypothetical protein
MRGKISLTEDYHELLKRHSLKVFTIEFKPIDQANIFEAVKCTFDNFIGRDVFVVSVPPAGTFPVNACLGRRITRTHIRRLGVGFLFNDGNSGRIEFRKNGRHDTVYDVTRGRKV